MIMNMGDFAAEVLAAVNEKADGTFHAEVVCCQKNNSVTRTGITVACTDENILPCVYLEGYYKCFQEGRISVGEAAEAVLQAAFESREAAPGVNPDDILTWEHVKDLIQMKLINAKMNRELLEKVPHRMYLDLAVTYYILMDENAGMPGSIAVYNRHMEIWGQDEEGLYQAAMANMAFSNIPVLNDVRDIIPPALLHEAVGEETDGKKPEGDDSEGAVMYVLSNCNKVFGAIQMANPDTLREIARLLDSDYIILPSSVHEVMVTPKDRGNNSYGELATVVREINEEMVDPEEQLSNHVYLYSRELGALQIVA